MADEVLYVVSDTHLGDGSAADRFLYPQEFIQLLARIETEPRAHLVLLGDFLELWATSLDQILLHHAPIFQALARVAERHSITYVVGNHDCLPWYYYLGQRLGNMRITEAFIGARGAIVAVHGHQYDPFNQVRVTEQGDVKAPWVRNLVRATGFLGRAGGKGTANAIAGVGERVSTAAASVEGILQRESPGQRGYPRGETRYEEGARALLRAGARFVLMGHTHHPLTHRYGNRAYVNTGSWVWDRYGPTYARLADGELRLLDARTHEMFTTPDQ